MENNKGNEKDTRIVALSNIGKVRKNNEDATFGCITKFGTLLLVADGMGGHAGGEFASELAAQSFQTFVETLPATVDTATLHNLIKSWATDAHYMIKHKGEEMPQFYNMGTTFVGLLFYNGSVSWINIGDSRIYRFRDGILRQLSTDHSMREKEKDPTIPSNIIYNALGVGDSVFADVEDITQKVIPGDKFIICSDGLSDMADDETIESVMENGGSAPELVAAAKEAGGKDNVSVIVVEIIE